MSNFWVGRFSILDLEKPVLKSGDIYLKVVAPAFENSKKFEIYISQKQFCINCQKRIKTFMPTRSMKYDSIPSNVIDKGQIFVVHDKN